MASYILLVLMAIVGVDSKTWVAVNLTDEAFVSVRYGSYIAVNKAWVVPPSKEDDFVFIQSHPQNTVWPINPGYIGIIGSVTSTTATGPTFSVGGYININPYYGIGIQLNWTDTGEVGQFDYKIYLYYYQRVNLDQTPLSQICLENCFY